MPTEINIVPPDIEDVDSPCCPCESCISVGPGTVVLAKNQPDKLLPVYRIIPTTSTIPTGRKHLGYWPSDADNLGSAVRLVIQWPGGEDFILKDGYKPTEFGSITLSDHEITQTSCVSRYESDTFNYPYPGVLYSYDSGYSGRRVVEMALSTTSNAPDDYTFHVSAFDTTTSGFGANEIRWDYDSTDSSPKVGTAYTYTLAQNTESRDVPSSLAVRAHATAEVSLLSSLPRRMLGWLLNTSDDSYQPIDFVLSVFRHEYVGGDYCEWPVQYSVDTAFNGVTSDFGNLDPVVVVDSEGSAGFINDGAADLLARINVIGAAQLPGYEFELTSISSGNFFKADCLQLYNGCTPEIRPHVVFDKMELECASEDGWDRLVFFGDGERNTWLYNFMNYNMGDYPLFETPTVCD